MSPEFMSEDFSEQKSDINQLLHDAEARPSAPAGRWSGSDMDEVRVKVRGVYRDMQLNERIKQLLTPLQPKSKLEPEVISGSFEADAEKKLRKDVLELEVEEPTHAHLGSRSEPIGISNQRSEQPDDSSD